MRSGKGRGREKSGYPGALAGGDDLYDFAVALGRGGE